MKKLLLLCSSLLGIIFSGKAQNFEWAQSYRGPGSVLIKRMTTDAAGNCYFIGDFTDSIDIDPTSSDNMIASAGYNDIFFGKLDSSGAVQWIHTLGDVNNEHGMSITLDNSSNVLICGAFTTTMDFDPGPGTATLNYLGSADGFVAKYDNDGNFLWVRQQAGSAEIYSNGVACDNYDNVYVTGHFFGSANLCQGQTSIQHNSLGQNDVFVVKLNSNGDYIWSRAMGGYLYDKGVDIAVGNDGEPVLTGFFQDQADLDPGTSIIAFTSLGNSDIFTCKLDSSGAFSWASNEFFNSPYLDEPTSIHIDGSNRVYISGHTINQSVGITVRMSSGGQGEKFLALYNPTFPTATGCVVYGVTTDADENIYITGAFRGTIDLDADTSANDVNMVSAQAADIFVAKYDSSASEMWTAFSISGSDQVNYTIGLDAQNSIYMAGAFFYSINCSYAQSTSLLTAQANNDAHIHKLSQAQTNGLHKMKSNEMSLYPNPANDLLFLDGLTKGTAVTIYHADGRLVKTVVPAQNEPMDVSTLAPGLYYLRAEKKNAPAQVGKFVKL